MYWEHNLVQMNYEKLRNDENRLGQFIVDKYKRRQFINTKHKDPMSLILEGKNPVDEYGEEESLTNAKETQYY